MKYIAAAMLWLCCAAAYAGDVANLDFLGFSKDGKYLAFEQYGITDGEGAPYSELYFIEVAANKWAAKPLILNGDEDQASGLVELRQQNRAQGKELFDKFGIPGGDSGTHLVAHNLHDLGVDLHHVRFTPGYPIGQGVYISYELTLEERAANSECFGFGQARIFTLTLTNQDSREDTVLQHDRKLPSSRGCAFGYRIQDVYLHSDKYLAVILNLFTPGYEGRNVRYLAVTGLLK